jgi:hypothetical protein
MEDQGYQVQDNVLFQDNKSAILLEKNGKASSSKHTKHVNTIWYFFITDHIDNGNVSLVWCSTGDMIGDFMTKPLYKVLCSGSSETRSWECWFLHRIQDQEKPKQRLMS